MENLPIPYSEIKTVRIKHWAEEDRPREKLLLKGVKSLSNVELLALLIGSGTKSYNAVEVARELLKTVNNDLNKLSGLSLKQIEKVSGIGPVKAITITGAIELGRRRKVSDIIKKKRFTCSLEIFEYIISDLMDLPHEEFWVMMLDRKNQLIKKQRVSSGGVSDTSVDLKMIFKIAFEELASNIVLIHNHPSGDYTPSQSDIKLTRQLIKAGELMDIPVLDHLIVTNNGYFSFKDNKR